MVQLFVALQTLFAGKSEDKGATMVEYGLMVALIAVVVAVAVGPLGAAIATMFGGITTSI